MSAGIPESSKASPLSSEAAVFIEPLPLRKKFLHLFLFLSTAVTTTIAGAMQQGVIPWEDPGQLYKGIPFAGTLLLILGVREMGRYWISRFHRVDISLPFLSRCPLFHFSSGTGGLSWRPDLPFQTSRLCWTWEFMAIYWEWRSPFQF